MSSNPSPTREWEEPTTPTPPRFWWFKRLTAATVLLLAALAALRWWWGWEAQRRIGDYIAAARARGEPVLAEDFDPKPVPDDQNAALSFKRAVRSLAMQHELDRFENQRDSTNPMTAAEGQQLAPIIAANKDAVQLARRALSQRGVDWNVRFRRPIIPNYVSSFTFVPDRQFGVLLRYASEYAHSTGDDANAIELARVLLRYGELLDQRPPMWITHLVAIGTYDLDFNVIAVVAPHLSIRSDGPESRGAAGASQVRDLIAELMDERIFSDAGVRAWYGERLFAFEAADELRLASGEAGRLLAPMYRLEGLRLGRELEKDAMATGTPNYPTAAVAIVPGVRPRPHLERFARIQGTIFTFKPAAATKRHFECLRDRRQAAVVLALRLYASEHGGALPVSLEQLVPAYLPSVPKDPMYADGRPVEWPASFPRRGTTQPTPGSGSPATGTRPSAG